MPGFKDRVSSPVWLITLLTAGCILLFQIFWLYHNYLLEKQRMENEVTVLLQHSVDNYLLRERIIPPSLSEKVPYLSLIDKMTGSSGGNEQGNSALPNVQGPVDLQIRPLKIDTANLAAVRVIIARVISLSEGRSVDLQKVGREFSEQLRRKRYDINFHLSLLPAGQVAADGNIAAYLAGERNGTAVAAGLLNYRHVLFARIWMPSAVSLFLILLTGSSLWYLGRIIRRQKKLDIQKNHFISNITHELRTPLSILRSTNEALLQFGQASDPEKNLRYLKINDDILKKLDHNLDRLLDVTRHELGVLAPKLQKIDLFSTVSTSLRKFDADDEVRLETTSDERLVTSDPEWIDSIVTNLVDNALKYSPRPAKIRITATVSGSGWQLIINDRGKGLPPDQLGLIFKKFYRVPSGDLHEVKGYGIGLSHVRQLVGLLNGEIRVKSKLGYGTEFILTFPQ